MVVNESERIRVSEEFEKNKWYVSRSLENRITALEDRPVLMEHIHPETNKGFTRAPVAVR